VATTSELCAQILAWQERYPDPDASAEKMLKAVLLRTAGSSALPGLTQSVAAKWKN
jgi:hypothetical protein